MQMSAAIAIAFSTVARASRSVFSASARAAASANAPPEPIAIRSCSGSITSPVPEIRSDWFRSATTSSASSRRSIRSVRQSFASSIAARGRLPYCSSFFSKSSNSVNASAVPPAKPATTLPSRNRRTLRALPFMIWLPIVTWPSPPTATLPLRRTQRIVVPWNSLISSFFVSSAGSAAAGPACPHASPRPGRVRADEEQISLAAPCAGMRSIVDVGEMLEVKMRIDLRRRQARVAEQLLDGAQIPARLEQMRRERVAQHVRMDPDRHAAPPGPSVDPCLDRALAEPRAAPADEKRPLAGGREAGTGGQPCSNRGGRDPPDRHDPGFRPLAEDPDREVVEVEVRDVEPRQLRQAEAGRIEKL